jgi:hypothetical protein
MFIALLLNLVTADIHLPVIIGRWRALSISCFVERLLFKQAVSVELMLAFAEVISHIRTTLQAVPNAKTLLKGL